MIMRGKDMLCKCAGVAGWRMMAQGVLVLLASAGASAADWSREPIAPVDVRKGDVGTVSFPEGCDEFVLEGEMVFDARRGRSWEIDLRGEDGRILRRISGKYDTAPLYDGFADSRYLAVELDSVDGSGRSVVLDRNELHRDREVYAGRVTLTVSNDRDGLRVWIGSEEGVYAAGGARVDGVRCLTLTGSREIGLRDAVVKWRPSPSSVVLTEWIGKEIVTGDEAPEGMWEYLDRDTDSRWAEPGGRYRLAVVKNGDGVYDILYVGGAGSNGSRWVPGMLKGRMTATDFDGFYRLVWYDAWFEETGGDATGRIVSPGILEFRFPELHAVMRFSAVR